MQEQKRRTIDVLFVLTLFALYTLSSLFLAVIGANIYQQNVSASEANYNIRTSSLYLTEKARQSESAGNIRVDSFGDGDALVLSRTVNEQVFETWIYVENGSLSEILVPAGTQLIPGIGQKIMPLKDLALTLDEIGLLKIYVTDNNDNHFASQVFLECTADEAAIAENTVAAAPIADDEAMLDEVEETTELADDTVTDAPTSESADTIDASEIEGAEGADVAEDDSSGEGEG